MGCVCVFGQALDHIDKYEIPGGGKLEVKFANRKPAVQSYRNPLPQETTVCFIFSFFFCLFLLCVCLCCFVCVVGWFLARNNKKNKK